MAVFNEVLNVLNQVIIGIVSFAFAVQIIYLLIFFVPARKIAPAKQKHKFAVVVSAHNEEAVLPVALKSLMHMKYPKELFRVFVIADNCTDRTAEIARRMGAFVIERQEPDPKKRNVGYALQYALPIILEAYPDVEAFVRFDADNILHPDYLLRMNDAYDGGAVLARGYNHATNITQNVIAGVSGLWYIRDCRFNCQARSALGIGQMMVGGGMMFAASLIREYGWTETGMSEDAEFTMDMLLKKHKAVYVKDAIVFEEQPSSFTDLFKRNCRIGHGSFKLFFTHGLKCFLKFFVSLRYSLFDVFLSMLFMPIAVVLVFWFPIYYIYLTIFHFASGGSFDPTGSCTDCGFFVTYQGMELNVFTFIGWILLFAFIIPFIAQAVLVYVLDFKRIGMSFWKVLPSIITFPLFMVVYAAGIALGSVSNPKWKSAKRSAYYDESFVKTMEKATGAPFERDAKAIAAAYLSDDPPPDRLPGAEECHTE